MSGNFRDIESLKLSMKNGLSSLMANILAKVAVNIRQKLEDNDIPSTGTFTYRINGGDKAVVKYTNTDNDLGSCGKVASDFSRVIVMDDQQLRDITN